MMIGDDFARSDGTEFSWHTIPNQHSKPSKRVLVSVFIEFGGNKESHCFRRSQWKSVGGESAKWIEKILLF